MGYEVKLIIGNSSRSDKECEREAVGRIEDDHVWFPYKKDAKGKYIETGRNEIIFLTVAELCLCKIGEGALSKLIGKNEKEAKADTKNVHKWFKDGNTLEETDCYGARKSPVPVVDVIQAIEKDNEENYRRYDWALALLKSIHATAPSEFSVILYGY